jgi:addiction module HigA family antidote
LRQWARLRTHPGEVLREEFMKPLGLSANALALALRVSATRIGDILHAAKPRSPSTALRSSATCTRAGKWQPDRLASPTGFEPVLPP